MSDLQPLCDDWQCPSMWSCRHAFARSKAYWLMEDAELEARDRKPGEDECADYERDEIKDWLA